MFARKAYKTHIIIFYFRYQSQYHILEYEMFQTFLNCSI